MERFLRAYLHPTRLPERGHPPREPRRAHALTGQRALVSKPHMDLKSAPVAAGFATLSLEDERWLSFARSAPDATPFHHPAWLQALTGTYHHRGLVAALLADAGRVTARLTLL